MSFSFGISSLSHGPCCLYISCMASHNRCASRPFPRCPCYLSPPWFARLSCLWRPATSHTPRCIVASRTQRHAFSWAHPQRTWAKNYGTVFYLAATDLFEKRSTIYSGRPRTVPSYFCISVNFSLVHRS